MLAEVPIHMHTHTHYNTVWGLYVMFDLCFTPCGWGLVCVGVYVCVYLCTHVGVCLREITCQASPWQWLGSEGISCACSTNLRALHDGMVESKAGERRESWGQIFVSGWKVPNHHCFSCCPYKVCSLPVIKPLCFHENTGLNMGVILWKKNEKKRKERVKGRRGKPLLLL